MMIYCKVFNSLLKLIEMTLQEVEKAEETTADGEKVFIVNVLKQKNAKCGKTAPVAFSED